MVTFIMVAVKMLHFLKVMFRVYLFLSLKQVL